MIKRKIYSPRIAYKILLGIFLCIVIAGLFWYMYHEDSLPVDASDPYSEDMLAREVTNHPRVLQANVIGAVSAFRFSELWDVNEEKPSVSQEELKKPNPIIPILVYHGIRKTKETESKALKDFNVSPESFEQQLAYITATGYTPLTVHDLVVRQKEGTIPEKPILITFDDGWKNQYTYALPLLEKYHVPATFYIFPDAINDPKFMTWDDIFKIDRAGMEIACHSVTHPMLTKLDSVQAFKEMQQCRVIMEKQLGKPITDFAYPYGDYNHNIVTLIQDAGYDTGRTSNKSKYNSLSNLFTINALDVHNDFEEFKKMIAE